MSRASGLRSPMVSDHEHNWGKLGPGGCHALRACGLPWSPIMSQMCVTRFGACGLPWSPMMSAIGGPAVSDHEHNWGHWGLVGVTRFGPVVFPQKGTVWGALVRQKCQAIGDGWHALGSVVSHGRCHAVHGFHSLRSDRGWEGVTHLGPRFPWSPLMSTMVRVRDLHGLRSRATGVGRVGLVSVHMLGGCRGSGPRSRMVSDHKRRGLAKGLVSHGLPIMSALGRSPTVSDHERQGLGAVSRLGRWSSMVSGHEHSGAGQVSRDSGPWSPISTNLGRSGAVGSVVSHGLRS